MSPLAPLYRLLREQSNRTNLKSERELHAVDSLVPDSGFLSYTMITTLLKQNDEAEETHDQFGGFSEREVGVLFDNVVLVFGSATHFHKRNGHDNQGS